MPEEVSGPGSELRGSCLPLHMHPAGALSRTPVQPIKRTTCRTSRAASLTEASSVTSSMMGRKTAPEPLHT